MTPFLPLERVEPDISGTHGLNPVTLALPRQQEALSEKQRLLGAKGARLDAQAAAMLVEAKALDAEAQVLADEAAQALILSQQPLPPSNRCLRWCKIQSIMRMKACIILRAAFLMLLPLLLLGW